MEVDGEDERRPFDPQLTREYKCPHTYLRLELTAPASAGPLTGQALISALSRVLAQLMGKQGAAAVTVLSAEACPGGRRVVGFARTANEHVAKVSAACACLASASGQELQVTGVAPSLAQLALSSRQYEQEELAHLMADLPDAPAAAAISAGDAARS